MRRLFSILTGIILLNAGTYAQNMFRYDFGGEDFYYHNPAAAPGNVLFGDGVTDVALFSQYNFYDSPYYGSDPLNFQADFIRRRDNGLTGVSYSYDGFSYYSSRHLSARCSKGYVLKNGAGLSVGVGASLYCFDYFTSDSRSVLPDLELGVEYVRGRMHVGAALQNILSLWSYAGDIRMAKAPRSLWINLSYDCPLTENLTLTPFFSGGCLSGLTGDLGMKLSWGNKMSVSYFTRGLFQRNIISTVFNVRERVSVGLSLNASTMHDNTIASALLVAHF